MSDNYLKSLKNIYESYIFELDTEVEPTVDTETKTSANVTPENVINVFYKNTITDPSKIKYLLDKGKFLSITVDNDTKKSVYLNTTSTPNGIYKKDNQYVKKSDGTPIDINKIISMDVQEVTDDRNFIVDNFGKKIITAYRIGYLVQDTDPRKLRVSEKVFKSALLAKKDTIFDPKSNSIIINLQTPLKDGDTYKVDSKINQQLIDGLQTLDRTRNYSDKDRHQQLNKLIDDKSIEAEGIDPADTEQVSVFIRMNDFNVIPQELLKMENPKQHLKRYLDKNPIIRRYLRRMKKKLGNFVSDQARGESPDEAKERVDNSKLFDALGDDIFVVLDDEILDNI